jgi:hypothetical protein
MTEQWKTIDEYPLYAASNLGRIKNMETNHLLAGGLDKDGYRQVTLQTDDKQVCRRVCRLIAKTFISNPDNLPCVNHKDEIKTNDFVENLEWCTYEYNNTYRNRLKTTSKVVWCVEMKKKFSSMRTAEKETGIPHSSISMCCKGMIQHAGGYKWEPYNSQDEENFNGQESSIQRTS